MKIATPLISLAIALSASSVSADAQTFETQFGGLIQIGTGTTQALTIPTPDGQFWVLPADFYDWRCSVARPFTSNDGRSQVVNAMCLNTSTNDIVGTTVICKSNMVDSDGSSFFLSHNHARIEAALTCNTTVKQAPRKTGLLP